MHRAQRDLVAILESRPYSYGHARGHQFFFFFFLPDPCTLAHTQGSLESLRFRFKQCAFCPSLRFPTEILSLVERFFFPFLFPQTILDNVCRPIL